MDHRIGIVTEDIFLVLNKKDSRKFRFLNRKKVKSHYKATIVVKENDRVSLGENGWLTDIRGKNIRFLIPDEFVKENKEGDPNHIYVPEDRQNYNNMDIPEKFVK